MLFKRAPTMIRIVRGCDESGTCAQAVVVFIHL